MIKLKQKTPAKRPSSPIRGFHHKFGNGTVAEADGEKLTIDFDRAGRKRVLDSFVNPTG